MNQWSDSEYCRYFRTGDCPIDILDDTPSTSSSSSSLAAAAAMTSSCINDVISRSAGAHIGSLGYSGRDINCKPILGLKKCFHCPHCRYSTDRKNNLKRHLGTMHRDHYASRVMDLDQSRYRVSIQRRSSCVEDYSSSMNKRHVVTVLLDDFAGTGDVSTSRTDDVKIRHSGGGTLQHLSSIATTRTDEVDTDYINIGTQIQSPSSILTAENDDIMAHETSQNGDVISDYSEFDDQPLPLSPIDDCRNSLPPFEPRPETAYCRRSSRMFFYDRLRCTHDYSSTARTPSLTDTLQCNNE